MTGLRHLPPRLRAAVRAFALRHREFEDPSEAVGMCAHISELFAERHRGAAVLHLSGCRLAMPFRDEYWRHYHTPDPGLYHVVATIGGWCVDFTRRQFDALSPFPFVQTTEQLRRDWLRVSAEFIG